MHLILDPRSGNGRKSRYPKIGIIIGVVSSIIVVVIIVLVIFILIRSRSKQNQNPRSSSDQRPPVPQRLLIID